MKNVSAKIITGTGKSGKEFKAVQFEVLTSQGIFKSGLCFPTELERNLVFEAINPMKGIYGTEDTSSEFGVNDNEL